MKKLIKKTIAIILGTVTVAASVLSGAGPGAGRVCAEGDYDFTSLESLKDIYADRFKVGVAVQAISHWGDRTAEIGNTEKEELINLQFNSMTFGNEFKPAYNFNANEEGLFKVDHAAEELLDWAKENGMPVRGHCLVWHSQVNPSIFAEDYKATANGIQTTDYNAKLDEDCLVDRDTLLKRLKTYIYSVMEYTYANGYAETIYAWDVVNEAVDEGKPDGFRTSYWYQIIGPEFLYYSFLYAREAEVKYAKQYAADYGLDPDGDLSSITPELFYNDYNEWFLGKCNFIVQILTENSYNENHSMVKSDVINPDGDGTIFGDGLIDGIGLQGHLTDTDSLSQYKTAIEKYSAAINNLHVTELDVGKSNAGEAGDYRQSKFYYDFFKLLCDECDAGVNITSVTLWGLTDTSSWRKDTEPLIFNGDLSPKPAFEAVVMAGKGLEFDMKDTGALGKAEDILIDFEPVNTDGSVSNKTPTEYGFIGRGSGHQAVIMLKIKENHTEGANPGFSLQVRREAEDATLRYDISRFIGHSIGISYYIKSADEILRMGVDGYEDAGSVEFSTSVHDDWVLVETDLKLPEDLDSASLYFETDGNGEFLIDDFAIVLKDDENMEDGFKTAGSEDIDQGSADTPDGQGTGADEETDQTQGILKTGLMVCAGVILVAGLIVGLVIRKGKKKK